MHFFELITMVVVASGAVGMVVRVRVALSLDPAQKFNSTNLFLRYLIRYAIFSLHYFISFLITPAILSKLFQLLGGSVPPDVLRAVYLASCLPLASLLYVLDHRFLLKAR